MKPTNVLFIFSDEHDPRYMGCSGHPFIKTPNLDRLAARGTRFANAYTPCPVCVPARASLATGRYVHEIGYWDNAIAYDGRVPGWGHRMQDAGMRVESIGKLHYSNATDPTGFDRQYEPMHILNGIGQLWGSVRDPMPYKAGRSALYDKVGAGTSNYNRYDERIEQLAEKWLEDHTKTPDAKPWLLFVGLVAPHMPLVVPQQYLDLYPLDKISLPKLLPRDGYRRHPWIERMASHWDHDATLGSDERRKLAIACYFGLITFLDERIGRLLAVLERTGLAETTRVIYSSDHGDNLGTRGLWNKDVLYRESTGIPLLMAGPGIAAGKVSRTNVNLIDLYPTFLRAVGVPPVERERTLPGCSLFDVADAPDDPDRIVLSEYHAVGAISGAFMLVRGRYKYHHYVGYRPELFDLEADPEEMNDLAEDPSYADELAAFEKALRRMLDPEAVDRRAKDDQNALVARHGGRETALMLGYPGETPTAPRFDAV
ncbi:MAG: sulfatase-like hydrolase/transferase [Burkholderiaceae bacterium]